MTQDRCGSASNLTRPW